MHGLLLDTPVWLWYAEGISRTRSSATLAAIEEARLDQRLFVSAISIWQIGMQCAKGRISLSAPVDDWVQQGLTRAGMRLLPLDAQTALESTRLPGTPHGDPAYRFLIAAARVHALHLVTAGARINDYARAGYLNVLAA